MYYYKYWNTKLFRKSVAQVVRNSGEPYRPREWYTTKSCERQFKIIVSNYNKEIKLPFNDMLRHIAEGLKLGK